MLERQSCSARTITVGGLRVHYVDEGPRDAEPFLLVHGEPSWGYLYRRWIPRLVDAGYRVVVPDHVGFGRSDKVVEDEWYVIERHVEVQRALLDALDLRRINLFCQDWGGPISLRNACDEPDRYTRLFIGNTWLHHDGFEYTDALRTWRSMATLREHPTHRFDPEPHTVFVDERDHHGSRGSSTRAKNEEAASRISSARFSSLTSWRSAFCSAASVVVTPGRQPESI